MQLRQVSDLADVYLLDILFMARMACPHRCQRLRTRNLRKLSVLMTLLPISFSSSHGCSRHCMKYNKYYIFLVKQWTSSIVESYVYGYLSLGADSLPPPQRVAKKVAGVLNIPYSQLRPLASVQRLEPCPYVAWQAAMATPLGGLSRVRFV